MHRASANAPKPGGTGSVRQVPRPPLSWLTQIIDTELVNRDDVLRQLSRIACFEGETIMLCSQASVSLFTRVVPAIVAIQIAAPQASGAIDYISQDRWTSALVRAVTLDFPNQEVQDSASNAAGDFSAFVSVLTTTVTSFGRGIGPVSASVTQNSELGPNGITAQASAQYSSQMDGNPYINEVEIHSHLSVVFSLDATTTFQAAVSVGPSATPIAWDALSHVSLINLSPTGTIIDSTYPHANPGTFQDSIITLAPGTYRLLADIDLIRSYRGPTAGNLYWNVEFVVVPSPTTTIVWFGLVLSAMKRRNRS